MVKRPQILLVARNFIIQPGSRQLLAVQRSASDRHNPGKWEVPGGKVDSFQTFEEAEERETREEVGLLLKASTPLRYPISKAIMTPGEYQGMAYLALFGVAEVVGGRVKLSDEHDAHRWCGFEDFSNLDLTDETWKAALVLCREGLLN